jgi:predicted TIM-barrel fold metal-dependent hydrolase
MKWVWGLIAFLLISLTVVLVLLLENGTLSGPDHSKEVMATKANQVGEDQSLEKGKSSNETSNGSNSQAKSSGGIKELQELVTLYKDMPVADAHNHNAGGRRYQYMEGIWEGSGIDRVVLFGAVSEPAAVGTDELAWEAYQENPERYIPFFAGINLHDKSELAKVKENLEKGYFGIGEIAGATTYSEGLKGAIWKTADPMDGILPQMYELCAQYKAPLLLHIDPPNGGVIDKLEEAAVAYPNTTFIFAHANAYNSPENVEALLEKHPNIYMDFFAGFTAFNPESANRLEDYVPLMKKYPERFLLSTDSGYGLKNEAEALRAMYLMIDLLGDTPETRMIAYGNLDALISAQPATATQLAAIAKLNENENEGTTYKLEGLSKLEAGKILAKGNKVTIKMK